MEKREGKELSSKQRAAIAALIAGCNHQEAAAKAGVHGNRIGEWLKDPVFVQGLRDAEALALEAVSRDLLALASKARLAIETVLDDDQAADSIKLRAADVVLTKLLAIRELASLEARITALEAGQK